MNAEIVKARYPDAECVEYPPTYQMGQSADYQKGQYVVYAIAGEPSKELGIGETAFQAWANAAINVQNDESMPMA